MCCDLALPSMANLLLSRCEVGRESSEATFAGMPLMGEGGHHLPMRVSASTPAPGIPLFC